MARSKRKTPICSITISGFNGSEKDDKRIANRKARRKNNSTVNRMLIDIETTNDIIFVDKLIEVSDIWMMNKDGKHLFNPKEHPNLMRK